MAAWKIVGKHQTLYFSVTPHMSSLGNRSRCKNSSKHIFVSWWWATDPASHATLRHRRFCSSPEPTLMEVDSALHPRTEEMLHRKMPFNLWNKAATGIQNIINIIPVMGFIEPMHNLFHLSPLFYRSRS